MSSLADRVIRANDNAAREEAQNEQDELWSKFDDVGLPLPVPDTERAYCEYLVARILYLNKRMYKYLGHLWLSNEMIRENKDSYYKLARFPKVISAPQCHYVWSRLKEIVPELDTDRIAILPHLTFNMRTGEVKRERVPTTTPWSDNEDLREGVV